MKKIAFYISEMNLRGVGMAVFDYAHYNEEILNNVSLIVTPESISITHPSRDKFKSRFPIFYFKTQQQLEEILQDEGVDIFYVQKSGENDGLFSVHVKTVIHVVFQHLDVHGDVYAFISKWLSDTMTNEELPYVPYMVLLPEGDGNLRENLSIPDSAYVFGRYGGWETFDLNFVKLCILNIAKRRKDIYFLFMNTDNFINKSLRIAIREVFKSKYGKKVRVLNLLLTVYLKLFFIKQPENIIFLDGTYDPAEKVKFINTCDAMLHARKQGESFGLACGEFSTKNKPILTYSRSFDNAHLEILKSKAIKYSTYSTLKKLILNFDKNDIIRKNWDAYSYLFSPEIVMNKFKKVFIDGQSN